MFFSSKLRTVINYKNQIKRLSKTNLFKKTWWFSTKQAHATGLKRRKCGLGIPIHIKMPSIVFILIHIPYWYWVGYYISIARVIASWRCHTSDWMLACSKERCLAWQRTGLASKRSERSPLRLRECDEQESICSQAQEGINSKGNIIDPLIPIKYNDKYELI